MTMVGTTPPPRLPVREKTVRHRAGGVSPMLTRLAAERATGVLVRATGTLYLAEGRVVHAESPLAPGLDVLLTAHGTLDAQAWQDAVDRADEPDTADRVLLDGGRIAPGALELCHLSALYDAAYFALAPSSTPGRFRYGTTHWLGSVHPVPVGAVEHETLRRRALLHRIWPDPTTDSAPLERLDTAAAPAVAPRQSAVLARVDGLRTAADIARDLGRPAFHTLVAIRRLAAAGLVAPRPAPPDTDAPWPKQPRPAPPGTDASWPKQPRPAPPGTDAPWPKQPEHPDPDPGPGAPTPPGHPAPTTPADITPVGPHSAQHSAQHPAQQPDIELLKRVRDALEAL
ncbi:transcriptional regulator [Streptomyces spinoverrucosus]|uniref:transcriptional regulator n=1 Tax=Streptomyces spinoverrucosus TaxID=284043 RepID=UPI0018C35C9B|nr:transcriptional regulator [Streptomyces spinoverrucosus]MBG0854750.1 transcriptional regulator [Streptomyces spinoverrucosus]